MNIKVRFVYSFPITIGFFLETPAMHDVCCNFDYSLTSFQTTIQFVLEPVPQRPRRVSQF